MPTRRERVVLELEDDFTTEMAKAAAATALMRRNLRDLDGTAVKTGRSLDRDATVGVIRVHDASEKAGPSIDKLSGRMRILADVAAVLGPSMIPIGAVAVPAVAGLASQFGFAAVAGGTAVAAFQGVGDALKAVNTAALEPTEKNLQAAREAMEKLSPAARDLVGQLREMQPTLRAMRDTAASGMFPGLIEGLESMESVLPRIDRILMTVSNEMGNIASDVGASFASDRWTGFLDFLAEEAPSALRELAQSVGNVTHGMAELWMAFDPLNDDFSSWMVDATRGFDEWASGLDQTDGFQDFVDYIRTTGPQVADTLAALGNALLQVLEAAAPIGGPVLAGIEAFADVVSAIADSDLGTPIFGMVAAISALNLAMRTTSSLSRATFAGPVISGIRNQTSAMQGLVGTFRGAGAAQRDLAAQQARTRATTAAYVGQLQAANQAVARGAPRSVAAQARLNVALQETRDAHSKLASAEQKAAGATAARNGVLRQSAATAGRSAAMIAGLAVATTGAGDKMGFTNTVALGLMGTLAGPWGAAVGAGAGLMIDMASAGNDVASALARIDTAAKAGNLSKATSELAALEAKQRDVNDVSGFGDFFSDIGKSGGASLLQGLGKLEVDGIEEARKQVADLKDELAEKAAFDAALDAGRMLGMGFRLTAEGARTAGQSVDEFKASVARLSAGLTRQAGLDAYKSSLMDFADSVKENGRTLADNTRKGLANRAALRSIASSALEAAGSMQNFGRRTRFLDNARQGFIRAAVSAGATRREARQLATQLGLVDRIRAQPKVDEKGAKQSRARVNQLRGEIRDLKGKIVHMDEKGASAARARVAALRSEINRLQSREIFVNTYRTTHFRTVRSGLTYGKGDNFAEGGIVHAYANGGVAAGDIANRHQPELAGPGVTRVWREPETQGEAYIPLANDDRRLRAKAIAAEVVSRFGGEVAWNSRPAPVAFASGGITAPTSSTQAAPSLRGLVIQGVMDTPFGPAQVRGVVREEILNHDEYR